MLKLRPLLAFLILVGCPKPDPRSDETQQELTSFAKSLRGFRDQKGHWPDTLVEGVGDSCLGQHRDCLGSDGKRRDPWGNPYEYDQSLHSALVRSPGADQKLGTRDDLEVFVPAEGPLKP